MAVSGKFYVTRLEQTDYGTQVYLGAVCRGSQNKAWAQATPSGNITMNIRNEVASEQFVLHEEYEVIFTHVAKPKPGDGHALEIEYPPYDTEKKYPQCGFCGMYPVKRNDQDGELDWSAHEEFYGAPSTST
jgi:hypothetical protein